LKYQRFTSSELKNLELDTFNPDCLIYISNVDTFNFLFNPLLNLSFWISVLCLTNESQLIKWQFLQTPIDWLSYIKYILFCWVKFRIKLILKLTKRENHYIHNSKVYRSEISQKDEKVSYVYCLVLIAIIQKILKNTNVRHLQTDLPCEFLAIKGIQWIWAAA